MRSRSYRSNTIDKRTRCAPNEAIGRMRCGMLDAAWRRLDTIERCASEQNKARAEPQRDLLRIPPLSRACDALHSSVASSLVITRRQARASYGALPARLRLAARFVGKRSASCLAKVRIRSRMRLGCSSKRASAALTPACRFAHRARPHPRLPRAFALRRSSVAAAHGAMGRHST